MVTGTLFTHGDVGRELLCTATFRCWFKSYARRELLASSWESGYAPLCALCLSG
ncbi:MAG: hypothetical protein ACE5OR_04115 [bacterium]